MVAGDAMAPCITRSSTTIVLNVHDKQVIVFHNKSFQLLAPSQWRSILENAFFMFPEIHIARNKEVFSPFCICIHVGTISHFGVWLQNYTCIHGVSEDINKFMWIFVTRSCNSRWLSDEISHNLATLQRSILLARLIIIEMNYILKNAIKVFSNLCIFFWLCALTNWG